jgi:hypothetical protein
MVDNEQVDFEIGDIENFSSSKDESFSHSTLVMNSMKKAIDAGTKEMREGWINTKTNHLGQVVKTYVEDTRKSFIESVKTCCMVMASDIDKDCEEYIDSCLEDIEEYRKELSKIEEDAWNKQNNGMKTIMNSKGIYNVPGHITHPELKEQMVWFEVELYRSIFAELSRLTKRLDYYKAQGFEA